MFQCYDRRRDAGKESSIASFMPNSKATIRTARGSGRLNCETRSVARMTGLRDLQPIASPRWL